MQPKDVPKISFKENQSFYLDLCYSCFDENPISLSYHPSSWTHNGKAENHKHAVIAGEWNKLMFDPRCSVVKEGRHSVCHWLFKGEKGRRIYGKCCSPKHKALRGLYIE